MQQTEAHLKDLIIYETVSQIHASAPPDIGKEQIPSVIHCRNFEKAIEKRDRTMERYNQKVSAQREKVAALEGEIDHLTKEIKKRTHGSFLGDMMGQTLTGTKPGIFDNAEQHNKNAAKYNAILEVVRRLQDQHERVLDRHNDAVEKHNEAVEEAKEKLEELTAEAMVVIDDDMVAVMDRTNKIALKLSSSQDSTDLLTAIEICFLQLKLSTVLEDHIEGNVQRRDFKEHMAEVNKLLADLCANPQVLHHKSDLFRRNINLIAKNRQLNSGVLQTISSIESGWLDQPAETLRRLFAEQFNTNFEYKHLISPSELNDMVTRIRRVIVDLNDHRARVKTAVEIAAKPAELAAGTQQTISAMLADMKSNQAGMANDILHDKHFACEMLNPMVIEDFYHRDLKPAVTRLKEDIARSVGEDELAGLVAAADDRYFIKRTEAAIKKANLLRLKAELDKVDSHLRGISGLIAGAEADIDRVGEVPREQAGSFLAKASTVYLLACLPWIGIGFALSLLFRIKSFEAAFTSANEIYRQLGSDIVQKNTAIKKVTLILSVVVGLGGIILFFALRISDSAVVNAAVPGAASALYLGTTAIFGRIEKQIREYQVLSGVFPPEREEVFAQEAG
jgi:hypothetical protein